MCSLYPCQLVSALVQHLHHFHFIFHFVYFPPLPWRASGTCPGWSSLRIARTHVSFSLPRPLGVLAVFPETARPRGVLAVFPGTAHLPTTPLAAGKKSLALVCERHLPPKGAASATPGPHLEAPLLAILLLENANRTLHYLVTLNNYRAQCQG